MTDQDIRDFLERMATEEPAPFLDTEPLTSRARRRAARTVVVGALGVAAALVLVIVGASLLFDRSPNRFVTEPTPTPPSVDEQALAYALDGDIYVADPDGMNAVKLADGGAPEGACPGIVYSLPSWSPDGRYLAFQRACWRSGSGMVIPQSLVISDPDGTVVAEIPSDLPHSAAWSPDSTRVAVWEDSGRAIGVYGVDGVHQASLPSPLSAGRVAENAPVWTPDGAALLLTGAPPPWSMVLPLDGSPAYELSPDEYPIYSPDGTLVAVVGDDSTVITDGDGAPVSEVDEPLRGVAWSPDGDRLASVSSRGELIVVDVASGQVTVLLEAGAALPRDGVLNVIRGFSPQGDRILFAALVRDGGAVYNSLFSIGVDGSGARLLVDGAMQGQFRPR